MKDKSWWKSKTIWIAIGTILSGAAYGILGLEVQPELIVTFATVVMGLMGITIRDAIGNKK